MKGPSVSQSDNLHPKDFRRESAPRSLNTAPESSQSQVACESDPLVVNQAVNLGPRVVNAPVLENKSVRVVSNSLAGKPASVSNAVQDYAPTVVKQDGQ